MAFLTKDSKQVNGRCDPQCSVEVDSYKSLISKMRLKFYDFDTNVQIYTWKPFCDMKDLHVQILL